MGRKGSMRAPARPRAASRNGVLERPGARPRGGGGTRGRLEAPPWPSAPRGHAPDRRVTGARSGQEVPRPRAPLRPRVARIEMGPIRVLASPPCGRCEQDHRESEEDPVQPGPRVEEERASPVGSFSVLNIDFSGARPSGARHDDGEAGVAGCSTMRLEQVAGLPFDRGPRWIRPNHARVRWGS